MSEKSPQIILINGASSAGKTTLCKALQEHLAEPYIHLEENRFVYETYHPRYLVAGVVEGIFTKTMTGYYRSLRAFVSAGHNVLADTGFYSEDLVKQCAAELAGLPVWLVGVHCSLAELERREAQRADRSVGTAREQFESIHAHAVYDVEVDTSQMDSDECAERIKAVVESGVAPSAFWSLSSAAKSP